MHGEGHDTEGQVHFLRGRKSRALEWFHLLPSCKKENAALDAPPGSYNFCLIMTTRDQSDERIVLVSGSLHSAGGVNEVAGLSNVALVSQVEVNTLVCALGLTK
jgi:hypothetical protein